jgi:CRP-like cAMP-binding protein
MAGRLPGPFFAGVDPATVQMLEETASSREFDDPALASNALAIVGSRNREMLDRLIEVSTQGLEQRLARALLRLADLGGGQGNGETVELRTSRQELAEMTATTLHTVSRFISRWEAAGLVSGGRGRIVVLDRAGLTALLYDA